MIKVSVLYSNEDGASFDMEYYRTTHMEIVERTMKPAKIEIERGVDGPYAAMGHLFFEYMDAVGNAMGNGAEAMGDIPNFTAITPVVQTSEVVDR
jgi:uncharacterized protein (TIGR02118 family)